MSVSTPETPPVLEISGLSGGWGETVVIEDLSLGIAAGETIAIIGRNGVGKSTLLELITGRARRRAGSIRLNGVDLSQAPTFRRSEAGVGYVPQEREVFPSLTVRENLRVARRPGPWTEERLFALFPSLSARAKSHAWQLSGGEQQMLSIARALHGDPKALLMDEPTEGLAPVVVEQLMDAVRQVTSDKSLAVIIVEQRVDIVLEIAERCVIMDRGRIVHEKPSAELRADPARLAELIGLE
jgi:branched-chain amino acid transport system ATP-binding protein